MKAKTRFIKMFYKLPPEARKELVYDFTGKCFNLNVCAIEIRNDTKLGKEILVRLGYVDEEKK